MLHMKLHISDTIIYYRMSESELMNAADGSLLDISLEEELGGYRMNTERADT